MRNLTKDSSKVMLKIKGKPILEHKIAALPRAIKEIVLVVGYQSDQIMRHFKRSFDGRRIVYVIQGRPTGTGGALHLAKGFLGKRFLVMMGDDLYHRKDVAAMLKDELAVLGTEVEDTSRFGIIRKNSRGNMIDIVEKPKRSKDKLANAGMYMLDRRFFDYDLVPVGGGEFGLPQTLASMARDCRVKVERATLWQPIGVPEDLETAEKIIDRFVR